jgi:hypothetical protein
MGPFLGSLALLDGIGQLAVEMRSVLKLVISCLFLGCRRTSILGEVRGLNERGMDTDERRTDTGTYHAQFREAEIGVLIRGLSRCDHDPVESSMGYRDILGQLFGGVNTGQG